jgi:hypothetical protein
MELGRVGMKAVHHRQTIAQAGAKIVKPPGIVARGNHDASTVGTNRTVRGSSGGRQLREHDRQNGEFAQPKHPDASSERTEA